MLWKTSKNKAIFFDRDGVINRVVFREGKPSSPWRFEEFEIFSDIKEILEHFKSLNFLNIIFTNQPDITRNNLNIQELEKIHKFLMENLPIDRIEVCPHDDKDNCFCRKPKPGLILQAAQKLNIELSKSYVIGDNWKDIKAGKAAGCKTFLIRSEYNKDYKEDYDFEISNLKEAVEIIKKLENL